MRHGDVIKTNPTFEDTPTMHMQKKKTLKDDGRFLTYYHFPDTATPEETAVYDSIEAIDTPDDAHAGISQVEAPGSGASTTNSPTVAEVKHV